MCLYWITIIISKGRELVRNGNFINAFLRGRFISDFGRREMRRQKVIRIIFTLFVKSGRDDVLPKTAFLDE